MPIINAEGLVNIFQNTIEILPNTTNPNEAFASFADLPILGIEFPTYADGRGATLAKRLRRLGFKGKLRAIGPLIPDQFSDLIACGFDEVEISQEQLLRQPIEQWLSVASALTVSYQRNNGNKISILEARRAKNSGK